MTLDYVTMPGDLDRAVADDHAVVRRQFEHAEAGRGNRRVLADQICFQLALHADAEEKVLYPALVAAGLVQLSDQGRDDHQDVKERMVIIGRTEPGEPEFEAALARIIEDVRTHAEDEEMVWLPRLRESVGAQRMAALGRDFIAVKPLAPAFAHPLAPSSGLGHQLADPAAALVDKVRDRVTGRRETLATDPSGLLNPQAQAVLDALSQLNPIPQEILSPTLARKQPGPDAAVQRALQNADLPTDPEPVARVEDMRVPGPGGDITVRVYWPLEPVPEATAPVLMWIHGGGWVLFDLDTYDASCRGLANKAHAIVVSPEYRLAPEHPFPASHEDVLAVWQWLRDHAGDLGGDPARIAIGGESVGGTMAAATSYALAATGQPLPAAQVLVYPVATGDPIGDSILECADARPLSLPLLTWMAMHAFDGVSEGPRDPRVNLLSIPADVLASSMPPTLVITAERDVLRDQGELFAGNLERAGVPTDAVRYDGVMHEFFGAAAIIDAAGHAQQRAAAHVAAYV